MIKKITKVGNSHALILDTTLMGLLHLKAGDEVNVEVHSSRTLTLTPMAGEIGVEEASGVIDEVMDDYARTMRRLA